MRFSLILMMSEINLKFEFEFEFLEVFNLFVAINLSSFSLTFASVLYVFYKLIYKLCKNFTSNFPFCF